MKYCHARDRGRRPTVQALTRTLRAGRCTTVRTGLPSGEPEGLVLVRMWHSLVLCPWSALQWGQAHVVDSPNSMGCVPAVCLTPGDAALDKTQKSLPSAGSLWSSGKRAINEIKPMKWKVIKRRKLDDSAKKENEGRG